MEFEKSGAASSTHADRHDFGVYVRQAEVGRESDPAWRPRSAHGFDKRHARRGHGKRVAPMLDRQCVEHQRKVGNIARHGAFDPKQVERGESGAARHASRRGAQSDDRAIAGRDPQTAAEIAAHREPLRPGSERRRRAARFERVDRVVVGKRNRIREDRRAVGGGLAADVVVVLRRDRQAGEPAGREIGRRLLRHEPARVFAGDVEEADRQRVHLAVHRFDAGHGGIDEFQRRYFALAQPGHGFGGGQADELFIRIHCWSLPVSMPWQHFARKANVGAGIYPKMAAIQVRERRTFVSWHDLAAEPNAGCARARDAFAGGAAARGRDSPNTGAAPRCGRATAGRA